MGTEFRHVVGKEYGIVAGARDGDVCKAGVEQVRVNAGVGVNEDALGGEALGAVASDRVAMVEMRMLAGIEFDLAIIAQDRGDAAIGRIDSMTARSRFATPSALSGAVNWIRSPAENSRSISR